MRLIFTMPLHTTKIEKGVIESNSLAHPLVKFIDLESISPYDLSRPINDLTHGF